MPTRPFALIDVFARRPLTGNPLAVIPDGEGIDDAEMRAIARELNQSETTFVLPARDPSASRRLRSFTAAGEEVTGIGHNALGAWWWLAETGEVAFGDARQEVGDGVFDLTLSREDRRIVVSMNQARARVGKAVAAAELAAPLGLKLGALARQGAQVVSTGAPHLLVAARDSASVDAARPDPEALTQVLGDAGAQGLYLYAAAEPRRAYARFFNPTVGLWEDAATGSAAGPLAWLLSDGADSRLSVVQGHAIGRPSQIDVFVEDAVVRLTGSAVLAAEGRLHTSDREGVQE